jgi:DNA-binding GntR family transcriptional regulator
LTPATFTQSERIFQIIEGEIISGALPMGTKLGEETLAARLGASRGPLREALRRLEGRSLVVSTARSGVRVVSMTPQDFVELYEVRESLESLAARRATENMTEEDLAGLRALLKRDIDAARADKDTAYSHGVAESDFHYRIALASRSKRLQKLLCSDLYSLIRLARYKTWHIPGQSRTDSDHADILKAMEMRDAELADLLMRRHVRAARQRYIAAIGAVGGTVGGTAVGTVGENAA